jgi:DNA-binding XRE family transcriptional regulator
MAGNIHAKEEKIVAILIRNLEAQISVLASREAEKRVSALLKKALKLSRTLSAAAREMASFHQAAGGVAKKAGRPAGKRRGRKPGRKPGRRPGRKPAGKRERPTKVTPAGLKALRRKLSVNQMELAKMLGVSAAAVRSWEQGRAKPRAAKLARILALQLKGAGRVGRPRKVRKIRRTRRARRAAPAAAPVASETAS